MTSPLHDLADRYWDAWLAAKPLAATFLGDHRFDDQVDDLSADAEQAQAATWRSMLDELRSIGVDGLDETDRVTHRLLEGELEQLLTAIDHRLIEMAWDQMAGVHADLLIDGGLLAAVTPEHAAMAVVRLEKLGDMLDAATVRFRSALDAGRTPARVNIERSINQIEGYLASDVADDPWANMSGPADWEGEEAWRSELAERVASHVRPAFERYLTVLREELLPVARPDDRAGLRWIDDGPELYRALIGLHTGVELTPEELHQIGRHEVEEVLPAQYREIGERVFGTTDLPEIFDRLLNDDDLRYRDRDEILTHAGDCLDRAREAMGGWFGIVPEAPCVLTPVPDYLAPDAPAAYYTPPAPDGTRPGEYHVNLHDPTSKGRAETASIAFHEAIPGHHLQLAIASERQDLPAFRRLSFSHTAYVEGWALYTERLAEEMGLYVDDLDRLGMLASDSWRACRLVVDTGLHALGWSRQRAVDYMTEHAPVSPDEISTEVDRYIGMPAQALAYKVGQREILRLRAEAEARLGDRFSLPGFHDIVLGAATVSLPVLAERVEAWTGA